MTKVAIVGSRNCNDKLLVFNILDLFFNQDWNIISGGASGVDTFAEEYAKIHNLNIKIIRPNNPSIKSDYIKRNILILNEADIVFIFWDGQSKGTSFCYEYCRKNNKNYFLCLI
jgi:hypothetical protein